jgi:BirA family transcriptional regulator, biotin operon repressor / biotin---[acetyl-CoA-carboxylase] ligase
LPARGDALKFFRVPHTDVTILREFLAHPGELVTGTRLAKQLGISRVAVFFHLKRLIEEGFRIESEPRRGYRLIASPDRLHEALIRTHLGRMRAPHLVCLDTVDSTNSEAERRLAADEPVPLVILARSQTRGRGRRGRPWHSTHPGNLYATFVFRPQLEPARLQDFTLWLGASLCELVENFCRLSPGLKWPNDLFLGGRKAGGMLTEARIDADQVRDLVFGLGLNVNGRADDLPADLRRIATSLADEADAPIDLNKFAAALIGRVLQAYAQFVDGSYRARFAELWNRYDILRGKTVSVIQGTRTVRGIALGIDDEGSLIVRTDSGPTERFRAGEVTLGKEVA